MSWFRNKKAFITGGSSGIGKATARAFLLAGADVVIAARGQERLDSTVAELKALKRGSIEGLILDISDKDQVKNLAPNVIKMLGGLDILVNNAGVARPGKIEDIDDEVFEEMMRINYFGAVWVTRAFLPHFRAQRSGHICNISSFAGLIGIYGYTAYAASKFALAGFSDSLRQELLGDNIHVSLVFPADTETPQLEYENQFKPEETKAIAGNVKMMQPPQVAKEILLGIEAQRYHILPGLSTKFTHFIYRHFPWAVRWVMDNDLRKFQQHR